MTYVLDYEKGITNTGNLKRLKALMKRAQAGEKLVIGFIGGSITQGSLSSSPKLCYAYRVFSWWEKTFPKAAFTYVNAGIGGTTSQFGVARVEADLLSHKPDFVLAEFSVNDESNEHFMETYEGLIRRIYKSETRPAMLIAHNVRYDNGANAQLVHAKIARRYELPCISMQSSIYPELLAGRIENREITPDDLHPNDKGHELVASVISFFLNRVLASIDEPDCPSFDDTGDFPSPETANSYEHSFRYDNRNCIPALNGFVRDAAVQNGITDCFKNGWYAINKGDSIIFDVEGQGISVQYRRSVLKPAPIARVIVDGDCENSVYLDANFDEDWGDKLELQTITEHTAYGRHKVQIEITESNDCKVPFYIASIIEARS